MKFEYFGTEYARYYLPIGCLNENSKIASFGVGKDVSFEEELIEKYGSFINCYDPCLESIKWYKDNVSNDRMILHPLGLSDKDGLKRMHFNSNPNWVSMSTSNYFREDYQYLPVSTIDRICGNIESYDLIKMDIEGDEVHAIHHMLLENIFPRILSFELHDWASNVQIQFLEKKSVSSHVHDGNIYTFVFK